MSDKEKLEKGFKWIEDPDTIGEMKFTFDGEKIYNLFRDYPHELTPDEKVVFDAINPYWADFFKDRTQNTNN